MSKNTVLTLWGQNQYFISEGLNNLTDDNRHNRLGPDTSSAGFLMQHMAESNFFLMHMFFGTELSPTFNTINGAKDEGQSGSKTHILGLHGQINKLVVSTINSLSEAELEQEIDTFIGRMTRSACIGVLIYHATYHLGQATLSIKKGASLAQQIAA